MKFETLVTRYKNLGYEPKGFDEYLEIESIIKWLYDTHDIYIGIVHFQLMSLKDYGQFCGAKTWFSKEDHRHTVYCHKKFDNPYDAKFDAVRATYSALKFQRY